jgi:hypothetical protein
MAGRSVMSQLATAGEEALGRLAQNPVTHRALESALQVRDRVAELVSGLADMDGRVTRLEKRIEVLEGKSEPATATTGLGAAAPSTSNAPSTSEPPAAAVADAKADDVADA